MPRHVLSAVGPTHPPEDSQISSFLKACPAEVLARVLSPGVELESGLQLRGNAACPASRGA
eukprot:2478334-Pyramimonas_sp.AAC.2